MPSFVKRSVLLKASKRSTGADLAAQETVRGDVREERDDTEQPWCGVHGLSPLLHEAAR